jgi:transposase
MPWTGLLVSDGYRVYQSWECLRQSCVAYLIRAAKGLAESVEAGIARFGGRVHAELQRLCHMGTERPTVGQWRAWYARFSALVNQHTARPDKAGTFARRLAREGEAPWVFLDVPGVEATNNIAERAHRFGVLWRKRSQGTCSEKGNRWVERVLSLRYTCRIQGRPTFPMLVEAVSCLFKGEMPDLSWITQHESLPVPSPRDQIRQVISRLYCTYVYYSGKILCMGPRKKTRGTCHLAAAPALRGPRGCTGVASGLPWL